MLKKSIQGYFGTNRVAGGRLGRSSVLVLMTAALADFGCSARESNNTIAVQSVAARGTVYTGPKQRLVIGKFENRSPYMNGMFADNNDRLGAQARQILMTHLSQSGRFTLMDRGNMEELTAEANYSGAGQKITGGEIVITGAVTEFGRRETGRQDSIVHKSKTQTAYGKISVSIVDVATSRVLFSCQGAGEFHMTNRDVLGFGSRAGYDATLVDKVLNLATIEVVNHLVEGLESGEWEAAK